MIPSGTPGKRPRPPLSDIERALRAHTLL
jgi:hypothetical protein